MHVGPDYAFNYLSGHSFEMPTAERGRPSHTTSCNMVSVSTESRASIAKLTNLVYRCNA